MAIPYCLILSGFLLIAAHNTNAQDFNPAADRCEKMADSLGELNQYKAAGLQYRAESNLRRMAAYKRQPNVNASYFFAMANMPDSALNCLEDAVKKYGFSNYSWLDSEPGLAEVRENSRFADLKKYIAETEKAKHDPEQAQLITSDIDLFWNVYDRYKQDTTNAQQLFLSGYFEKGSLNLQEYYKIKTPSIGGLKGFVKNIGAMPEFYESIRANTQKVSMLTDTLRIIYRSLKTWYEPAIFPNATFVIGGWSSGGTVTDYGSVMGIDMQSADNKTPTTELNLWQQKNLIPFIGVKHVVAHELIHVQQNQMANDTILLRHAIQEGMADFLGELISGKTANQRLHTWALGKEKRVWADFKKEMFLNRYSNWIANAKQETPDHPADLGYWVGYQICKAYFDQAKDKKQAVYDMLNIKDYLAFLTESKIDEKLSGGGKFR